MKINILCTLGPASLDADILRQLDERGVDLFRINLSHTPVEAVVPTIEWIRRHSTTPICLDTEGAQVRCGNMAPDVVVEKGQTVRLTATELEGSAEELTLHPASTFATLEVGSPVSIDFDESYLDPEMIAKSGVEYFDSYNWDFVMNTKEKIRLRIKEMVGK